jgi:L-malate glycosyltransferase
MTQTANVNLEPSASRISVCLLCDTVGMDAGTEKLVIETARRLNHSKLEVHVCCLEDSPQLRSLDSECQTAVFPTESINSVRGLRQVLAFRRYLSRNNIQIVQAFMNRSSILAVAAALGSGRIVITSRLNTGYWYTPAWRTFFRILNIGTTRVLTNSLAGRDVVVKSESLAPEKVDVIYQGVNAELFRPGLRDRTACTKLGIPENAVVVGIVANLRPVKDLPLFLRAARIVSEACPEAAFLVIGQGEMLGELQALAGELGIRDNVFFTRGEGQVIDYLAGMSIGCLTSFSEGFSNAILEYMATGIPVVATDVGGIREAVVDGDTGCIVLKRSPEAFAQPIIKLLRNDELRVRMGNAALQHCLEKFEFAKTIGDLENYYSGLVKPVAR